jgi:hypothetical protein
MRDDRVADALPRSRNRLLVFAGTRDRVVPVRNAALIADPVPGSWVLRFADEGHGLPFESPKSVIYLSAEFWRFAVPLEEGDFQGHTYGVFASSLPAAAGDGPAAAAAPGLNATVRAAVAAAQAAAAEAKAAGPSPAAAAAPGARAAAAARPKLMPLLKPGAAPPASSPGR